MLRSDFRVSQADKSTHFTLRENNLKFISVFILHRTRFKNGWKELNKEDLSCKEV